MQRQESSPAAARRFIPAPILHRSELRLQNYPVGTMNFIAILWERRRAAPPAQVATVNSDSWTPQRSGICLASSCPENSPAFQRWVLDHKKNPSPGRDGRRASCLLRPTAGRTLLSSLIRDSDTHHRTVFPALMRWAIVSKQTLTVCTSENVDKCARFSGRNPGDGIDNGRRRRRGH